MRKKIVEDITPRRSIKDISIERNQKSKSFVAETNTKSFSVPEQNKNKDYFEKSNNNDTFDFNEKYNLQYDLDKPEKESKKGLYATIFVFILALVFGISSLLTTANVKIISKKDNFTIKESFSVKKDQPNGEFGYHSIEVSDVVSKQVEGVSDQKVTEKASGKIYIINETNTVQKLIANTRFENEKGLIYRIKDPVSVPAGSNDTNKKMEVTVYADDFGESYNIGPSSFTIPGLKGDPKFKTLYAKSLSNISGGFSGIKKIVDENTKKTVNIELSADLKKKLLAQIETQIPDNFILYQNTVEYNFDELKEQVDAGSTLTLSKSGKIVGFVFDKTSLSNKLVSIIEEKNGKLNYKAEVFNLKDLKMSIKPSSDIPTDIVVTIESDVAISSVFDKTVLKNDLMGLKKLEIGEFLKAKYPGILEAKINIFPFWKNKIPLNADKIKIEYVDSL